jgi:hypothetical protein
MMKQGDIRALSRKSQPQLPEPGCVLNSSHSPLEEAEISQVPCGDQSSDLKSGMFRDKET